jgi:hypothetical protein
MFFGRMRIFLMALSLCAVRAAGFGQDFSGTWKLRSQSVTRGTLIEPPATTIDIEQRGTTIRCTAGAANWSFTTDGKESRSRTGGRTLSTIGKWEGEALLINTIVTGLGHNYTLMDRWKLSHKGAVLTIEREIVQRQGGAEAALVYDKPGAREEAPPRPVAGIQTATGVEYWVEAGTKIPLVLINSVSTKQSQEGDRVYLQTAFPILAEGRIAIPPGSYVAGTLTFVKRPGRVMGRGELYLRFDSLTLPNGVTREFRSRPGALDGQAAGEMDRREGNIKSEGNKAGDARTVGEAAAAGASVGSIAGAAAGRPGLGIGAGAAAGAAAGIMAVLLTRGPDAVLTQGTTIEMILDRSLFFTAEDLKFERTSALPPPQSTPR